MCYINLNATHLIAQSELVTATYLVRDSSQRPWTEQLWDQASRRRPRCGQDELGIARAGNCPVTGPDPTSFAAAGESNPTSFDNKQLHCCQLRPFNTTTHRRTLSNKTLDTIVIILINTRKKFLMFKTILIQKLQIFANINKTVTTVRTTLPNSFSPTFQEKKNRFPWLICSREIPMLVFNCLQLH